MHFEVSAQMPAQTFRKEVIGSLLPQGPIVAADGTFGFVGLMSPTPVSSFRNNGQYQSKLYSLNDVKNVNLDPSPSAAPESSEYVGLANQVDNRPVVLSSLQVRNVQLNGLVPPQTAGDECGQQRHVPFTFHGSWIRSIEQRQSLIRQEPIPESNAHLLYAFHSAYARGQVSTEEPAIRSLVRETAHRA